MLPRGTQLDTLNIIFFKNSIFCYFPDHTKQTCFPKKLGLFGTLLPYLFTKNRAWGSMGVPKDKFEPHDDLDGNL